MTVTNAMVDAGSTKLYDMVTAVPEQTLMVYDDEDVVVPSTAVVIAGGDHSLPADNFYGNPAAPSMVDSAELTAARKAHRQARFPVRLLQAAFDIKVEHGEATKETDKRHILNYLTGMPLDSEPAARAVRPHQQAAAHTLRARRPATVRQRGPRRARAVPRRAAGVAADGPTRRLRALR